MFKVMKPFRLIFLHYLFIILTLFCTLASLCIYRYIFFALLSFRFFNLYSVFFLLKFSLFFVHFLFIFYYELLMLEWSVFNIRLYLFIFQSSIYWSFFLKFHLGNLLPLNERCCWKRFTLVDNNYQVASSN